MTLPNFLVIGAAKAGTTSLYHYLAQHPQVYMSPVKEPNFFACNGVKPQYGGPAPTLNLDAVARLEDYEALFDGVTDEIAIGEATPRYIWAEGAPRRIKALIPEAKLIAVLRNPVERAFSDFLMNLRDGNEPYGDLHRAIHDGERRLRENWQKAIYLHRGYYCQHLSRYFELFDSSQIKVSLYDDYITDSARFLTQVFDFLGVDPAFRPDMSRRHHRGGVIRNPVMRFVWTRSLPIRDPIRPILPKRLRSSVARLFTQQPLIKPAFPPEVRSELTEIYREDVLQLQDLIERDLSHWLSAEQATGATDDGAADTAAGRHRPRRTDAIAPGAQGA